MSKIKYTIKQVEQLTELPQSALRFYERRFRDWLKVERSPGGQRAYSEDNVKKIMKLKMLIKEKGVTIRGTRIKLGLSERLKDE